MSSVTTVNYATLFVVFAPLGFVVYRFLSVLVRVGKWFGLLVFWLCFFYLTCMSRRKHLTELKSPCNKPMLMWCVSASACLFGLSQSCLTLSRTRGLNLLPCICPQLVTNTCSVLSAFVPPHILQEMKVKCLFKTLLMQFSTLLQTCLSNSPVQGTVGFVLVCFLKLVFHKVFTLINLALLMFAKHILKNGSGNFLHRIDLYNNNCLFPSFPLLPEGLSYNVSVGFGSRFCLKYFFSN